MATGILDDLFANPSLRRVLFKSRFVLALLLLVPLVYLMRPHLVLPAFAVSMLGQAIQSWSFGALVKNVELTVRGPYLLARNPMYIGRYFLILGFVLLLGHWAAVLGYTVVYYLYMTNRVKREERRLQRVFGDSYAKYCAETNRFMPSPRALGKDGVWFFDWDVFKSNNAHWNVLGTLLSYGVLLALREAIERIG